MSIRKLTVTKTYSCKDSEVGPIALIYHKRLSSNPDELAAFLAEDPAINAAWLTSFKASIDALDNIRPSRTIIKENSDITNTIKLASKNCVEFGTRLNYWLIKAFPDSPGIIDSFGIVAANQFMRTGDTESMLNAIQNIINQIINHQAKLAATAWPASNLADYQNLLNNVKELNNSQEANKLHIPSNTDQAITLRNNCYAYVQNILRLSEIIHKNSDAQKHRSYQFRTVLNQIRPSSSSSKTTKKPASS